MHFWERVYRRIPLEDIPWRKDPADFLTEVVTAGRVPVGRALDLGCGTGEKAIFLAQQGFTVDAVDVSGTALGIAKRQAREAGVSIRFHHHDLLDLSFLKHAYDVALDWGVFHVLPEAVYDQYFGSLLRVLKYDAWYLLHVFSRRVPRVWAADDPRHQFSPEDISRLFSPHFSIVELREETHGQGEQQYAMDSYLMQRL